MKAGIVVGVVLVVVVGLAPPAGAAPGDLDPGFGDGGLAFGDVGFVDEFDTEVDVAVQADEKVVVVGNESFDMAVTRFDANGELDPTFSLDGTATVDFPGHHSSAYAVGIDSLGRIVVAGRVSGEGIGVARLTALGVPDLTFSGDGRHVFRTGPMGHANDLVIDGDDGVLVVGSEASCERGPRCFEVEGSRMVFGRLTEAGAPATTFGGGDGWRTFNPTVEPDGARAVALAPSGRILVAGGIGRARVVEGGPDSRSVVLRLWPGGRLDGSFGRRGLVAMDLTAGPETLVELAVDETGGIAAVGSAGLASQRSEQLTVVRLHPGGHFDGGFSGDGRLRQDLGVGGEWGTGVAVDGAGRLVVGGRMRVARGDRGVVLRYLDDGTLDPAFSGNGWVPVGSAELRLFADGMDLAPNGAIALGVRFDDQLGAARVLAA